VLVAHLARGHSTLQAARAASAIAAAAVRDGLRGIGHGAGPVDVLGLTTRAAAGSHEAQATRV
jgi:hydroxymethylpyrimidine/phosphomethylpyrimidine kinase